MESFRMRKDEIVVRIDGGNVCAVCKKHMQAGTAVQLSKRTTRVRHTGCFPRSDQRRKSDDIRYMVVTPGNEARKIKGTDNENA